MATISNYQQAKTELKMFKKSIQQECKLDKPKERLMLNDYTDQLTRDYSRNLTEYQKNLLHNFCAQLHPKK